MMRLFYRLRMLLKSQSGFTLIELMIALAITGFVGVAVVTTIYQLQSISNSHYTHIMAVKQVENAIHYMNRDVQSAQIITPQGSQGFPLVLTWISWDTNDTNTVTYSLQPDSPLTTDKLVRQYQLNQNTPTSTIVAKFINTTPSLTKSSYNSASHTLTLFLTSTVSLGGKQKTETRQLSIIPRPGS